jgi:GNAT superfamily N-acetyltransferase
VVAFYALANGAVAHKDVSAKTRRNMPDPIPVMVPARLAVDSAYQKQGLGSALLKDALLRTIAAAQIAGIRAVLLHAISDDAKRFYARAGFDVCPIDQMMRSRSHNLRTTSVRPARADDLRVGTDPRRLLS